MPTPATTNEFLDLVRKSGIHTPEVLTRTLEDVVLPDEPVKAAAALVKRGMLTQFQAKLLLNGRYRGFKIGPYVIRDQVGQGGMGTVYQAEHGQLRRRVAIKVLAGTTADSHKVAIERFLREARAAAALDHPNIVRIFDVGQQGEIHYLVMEYVEGQTLDKVVEAAGPIACGRAVEYITQAAAGLQHAYEKGFVHRDIKPGNLMLAKDGTVKILDMGLARSFEPSDKLTEVLDKGAVVGTADYISPEQAMNAQDLDIRADIYSLGASFFTLVTGRPPFEGSTTQKLLQHQMKDPPTLLSIDRTFPEGLSKVVAKMLAKKPKDRYQTPGDVIGALAPWLPNSARVVAGISGTDLNRSPSLRNTLNEVVTGSTARLNKSESGEKSLRNRWPLLAGLGVASLVLLGLAIAFLPGLFSPEPPPRIPDSSGTGLVQNTSTGENPTAPDGTSGTQTAAQIPTQSRPVAAAPRVEGVTYALDLTGRRKYSEKGKIIGDPSKPTLKWLRSGTSGDGQFPPDWAAIGLTENGNYHGVVEEIEGKMAVAARANMGTPAALLTPEVTFPSGQGKVSLDYLTNADKGDFAVVFRPTKPKAADSFEVAKLKATGGKWETTEIDVDFKGSQAGRLEIAAGSENEEGLAVSRFMARDPAPPAARVVMKLNSASLQPFVQRTIRFQEPGSSVPLKAVSESGPGKMPPGWYRWIEYPETTAEYFADGPPGAVALGFRAVAGPGGVQLNSPEFSTRSGRGKLHILYQTGPTSPGFVIRYKPTKPTGGTIFDIGTLPPTGGSWRLGMIDFETGAATSGLFELYNGAPGADSAVRIRDLYVTDPAQPTKN